MSCVDRVVQTEPSGEPVLVTEPTTLTDVELYVDMPQRIIQPEADTEARLRAGQASAIRARRFRRQGRGSSGARAARHRANTESRRYAIAAGFIETDRSADSPSRLLS